jgi:hypothetical protein
LACLNPLKGVEYLDENARVTERRMPIAATQFRQTPGQLQFVLAVEEGDRAHFPKVEGKPVISTGIVLRGFRSRFGQRLAPVEGLRGIGLMLVVGVGGQFQPQERLGGRFGGPSSMDSGFEWLALLLHGHPRENLIRD